MVRLLRLLPFFILSFLLILVVLSAVTYLVARGAAFDPVNGAPSRSIIDALPGILERTLLPSVVLTIFLSFFRPPGGVWVRLFTFIITTALAGAILVFGSIGIDRIGSAQNRPAADPGSGEASADFFPFREATIHLLDDGVMYVMAADRTDHALRGVVTARNDGALELISEGSYRAADSSVSEGSRSMTISPTNPLTGALFAAGEPLRGVFASVDRMNTYLDARRVSSFLDFLFASLALCALCASAYWMTRITRWPLFNALISILLLRGIFLLYELSTGDITIELVARLGVSEEHITLYAFSVLAALFLIINLVLLPSKAGTE